MTTFVFDCEYNLLRGTGWPFGRYVVESRAVFETSVSFEEKKKREKHDNNNDVGKKTNKTIPVGQPALFSNILLLPPSFDAISLRRCASRSFSVVFVNSSNHRGVATRRASAASHNNGRRVYVLCSTVFGIIVIS